MFNCKNTFYHFVEHEVCFIVQIIIILGPVYNKCKDAKGTAHSEWVLIVTKLFNLAVNDFDAKRLTFYSKVLIIAELIFSGTQCIRVSFNGSLVAQGYQKLSQAI